MIFLSCPTSLRTPSEKERPPLPPKCANLSPTLSASEWLFPGHVISPAPITVTRETQLSYWSSLGHLVNPELLPVSSPATRPNLGRPRSLPLTERGTGCRTTTALVQALLSESSDGGRQQQCEALPGVGQQGRVPPGLERAALCLAPAKKSRAVCLWGREEGSRGEFPVGHWGIAAQPTFCQSVLEGLPLGLEQQRPAPRRAQIPSSLPGDDEAAS